MQIDVDLIVSTVIACAKSSPEVDYFEHRDLANLVRAAVVALFENGCGPGMAPKTLLTGLSSGYGCWLQDAEALLWDGLERLPPEYDSDVKHMIMGSFLMAKHFLFDIEGHNKPFENAR